MRQVPPAYTLIGDGRMARHFAHYLTLLEIPFLQWSRRADPHYAQLPAVLQQSQRLLVLIRDDAIAPFIEQHVSAHSVELTLHFSGVLSLPNVIGAHPLMSFGPDLYPLSHYQTIPFMFDVEDHDVAWSDCLPGLPNPTYFIPREDKPLYHALCVLSGNFTIMLWQKAMQEFQRQWQIPSQALQPYLQRICQNLIEDPRNALTGPLSRGDHETVAKNIDALAGDPYHSVYRAFKQAYSASLEECTDHENENY